MEQNILVPAFDEDSKVIGLLAGPLGVLLGGTTGLLLGSASDCDRADYEQCLMAQRFDNWRVSQKHRLARLGARIDHAFARAST